MSGWECLIYLISLFILGLLLYKLIYHLIIDYDHNKAVKYNQIELRMKTINNFFCDYPIYYINLDRSKDRRKYIEGIAEKYSISNVNRISAIDGKKIKRSDYYIRGYSMFTNSELACLLSHIEAIRTSYYNNDPYSIIMEDDTGFGLLSNINYNIKDIIDNAPSNWEYINLCPLNPLIKFSATKYIPIKRLNGLGASTYIINRKGMKKILDTLLPDDKIKIDANICKTDSLYSDVIIPLLLNTYSYRDEIFYQNKTFPKEIEFSYAL